jgi:hypothetical protein
VSSVSLTIEIMEPIYVDSRLKPIGNL